MTGFATDLTKMILGLIKFTVCRKSLSSTGSLINHKTFLNIFYQTVQNEK
jgi:hypothetical protein